MTKTLDYSARVYEIMQEIQRKHGVEPMDDLAAYIAALQFRGLIDRQRAKNMKKMIEK